MKRPLKLPAALAIIRQATESINAHLVVLDPVDSFTTINLNSGQQVRRLVDRLQTFAESTGVAVVLVRHLAKRPGTSPLYRGAGSISLTGAARVTLQAVPDPQANDPHRHLLLQVKNNWANAGTLAYRTVAAGDAIRVEWLGASQYTVRDITAAGPDELSRLEDAEFTLYLLLREGPRWSTEMPNLVREAGVAWRTAQRAKERLGIRSRRTASVGRVRCAWELPRVREAAALCGPEYS